MNGLWTPSQTRPPGFETSGSTGLLTPNGTMETNLPIALADNRLIVGAENGAVLVDGEEVEFGPVEFVVLDALAKRADHLALCEDISDEVWGNPDYHEISGSLRVMVKRIRNKLGEELGDTKEGVIRTRKGLGYTALSSLKDPSWSHSADEEGNFYLIADDRIEVNTDDRLVISDGEVLEKITPDLFYLLAHLAKYPDRVLSTVDLAIEKYGIFDQRGYDGIRIGISKLRRHLGEELGDIETGAIRTSYGEGYYTLRKLAEDPIKSS